MITIASEQFQEKYNILKLEDDAYKWVDTILYTFDNRILYNKCQKKSKTSVTLSMLI